MPETGNLYEILGLSRYASINEVRVAFRRLAVLYHPDKNPGDFEAEERFKSIAAAYEILGDETKKRNYDLRLTGVYTYIKTENPEEKLRQRKERAQRMRQQKQKKEQAEIKQVYEVAQKYMPYKWRNILSATIMVLSLCLILTNWFRFTEINSREWSFFLMFASYGATLFAALFFLSSLFKKWNALTIDKPFRFDVRNRIATFFFLYILFMITFSFTVPNVYKQVQLSAFGKTTKAVVKAGAYPNLVLIYEINGHTYIKDIEVYRPHIGFSKEVIIRYSTLQPFICEIEQTIN